ncbi:MAG: shikimate kinase [Syntrophomonadaceae bacterium]|jgi:shikimate kinase
MKKNIVLIGFMGTGKSSVGQKLAERLNMQFIDMDREIENLIGLPVKEIFRRYGEVRFRSEEKLMSQKLGSKQNLVIATGGGTTLSQENVDILRENGIMINLTADAADILHRVSRKKGTRPLLGKNPGLADIETLLREREPIYACADLTVNTSNKTVSEVVDEVFSLIMGYQG